MNGGAWWATVHGVAKSWAQLSDFTFIFHFHAGGSPEGLTAVSTEGDNGGREVLMSPFYK